jgi:Peptidase family M1 domain
MRILVSLIVALFGFVSQSFPQNEADEVLGLLSKARLDRKQTFHVRDLTVRRDVLSITLNRGVIAFLEPVRGKVTGAVFIGSGEIVAIPPDSIEKQQIYKFTGLPILNETFENAIFRFTDDTFDEIKTEILQHADEEVSPEEIAQFESWDQRIADQSKLLNTRLLADLLESPPRPLFLAEVNGEKTGWFESVFDRRRVEEVAAFKIHEIANKSVIDLWTSFNQRSEARNPEAVAHEDKSAVEILGYDIDTTLSADSHADIKATVQLRGRIEGARVLTFDLSESLRVSALSLENGEAVPFYQHSGTNAVTLVLPRPLNAGQEISLRFSYSGAVNAGEPWYPCQRFQDSAMFTLVFHAPAGAAVMATGNGKFPSAGFAFGNFSPVSAEATPATALKYFSEMLGPYPYERLAVVRSSGGEQGDWPMLIQLPSSLDATAAELMMAQQIARQWFGHRVTPASYHDEWLFEGLARYLGAMYIESQSNGPDRLREILNDARSQLLDVENAGAIWLGQRLASTITPRGERAVTNKGLWVVHMLRMLMREDGPNPDARFLGMLREFISTYEGKPASTWDFKHLAEKHAPAAADLRRGKKLDWFFDEWVFGTGVPQYALDYKIEADGNAFTIEGTIKQSNVPDGFVMPVPVFADDQFLGRVVIGENEDEFRFRVDKKPERIVIDPRMDVLARSGGG